MQNIGNLSIDEALNVGINEKVDLTNAYSKGYKYYIPKGFKLYENNVYNQTLISNGNKYYLNVDIISYYNKKSPPFTPEKNSYYYKSFTNDKIEGHLEIIQKDDYFFMEMMYNYAIIEVVVEESEINYAIVTMFNILNSIEYNNAIIENIIGNNVLEQKETVYQIEEPMSGTDDKNFLDYEKEYGNYTDTVSSMKDEDQITDESVKSDE